MENADTYDAPLSAGDDKATPWPESLPPPPDDEAGKQLDEDAFTAQPSKEPSASPISPSPGLMKGYKHRFKHFLSALKGLQQTDKNTSNKEAAIVLLTQTLDQLLPTLPLDQDGQNSNPQNLLHPDPAVPEEDFRLIIIALSAALYPREIIKSVYKQTSLAGTQDFESLLNSGKTLRRQHPYQDRSRTALGLCKSAPRGHDTQDSLQREQQQQQQRIMAAQQAALAAAQDDVQMQASLRPQDYAHQLSFSATTFSPQEHSHLQYGLSSQFGQQSAVNLYDVRLSLAPSTLAANGGDLGPLSPVAPAALIHNRAASVNLEHSPTTQASSHASEAPASPPSVNGHCEGGDVICPLHDNDGRACGKRCSGAKPYRSIQEHIRRAHPDRYIAGLPANEESFQAMVNTEGVICPIPRSDGSACGTRCTGSKPYRSIQDHIRDSHPEHYVPALPANEASFRIMVDKPETISCPLLMPDGSTCTKRCFGDKRFRSIQEHIRRAHPERYISGLSANEESFLRMTSGLGTAKPANQQRAAPAANPVGDDMSRRGSSHSTQAAKQADLSPAPPRRADSLSEALEASTLMPNQADLSSSFDQQVWSAPVQQTAGTVAPEMLMTNELQLAPTDFASYAFNNPEPLQQVAPFQQAHFPNPPYSALSNTTSTLLDSDPTLSRELFDSQPFLGAVQTVYGNNTFSLDVLQGRRQHVHLEHFQIPDAQFVQQLIESQTSTQGLSDWPVNFRQMPNPELNDRSSRACNLLGAKRKMGDCQIPFPEFCTGKRAKTSD